MKKILLLSCTALLAVGCNNPSTETTVKPDSSASAKSSVNPADTVKIEYAYTLEHPADYWERGSQQNVALVLNAFKAFENKNVDESMKYFADSVQFNYDYEEGKFSRDSLGQMFKDYWKTMSSMSIEMGDFESVISKDKKEEWVTLWYKQKWTDKKGNRDSAFYMNDVMIVNGKIAGLDEKLRHYPKND